jgi:hypothetical protein
VRPDRVASCADGEAVLSPCEELKATKTEKTVHKSLAAGAGSIAIKLSKSIPTGTLTVKVFATDPAGNASSTMTLHLKVKRWR